MHSRTLQQTLAVGLVAAAAALGLTGAATAAPKVPAKKKMAIVGHTVFKVGKFAFDNQHYSPGRFAIKAGGKVTLRNKAKTQEPHTISLVKKSDLPSSFDCEICGQIFASHSADPTNGGVNPVVDVGVPGFDQPGDSMFVNPGQTVRFNVTAPAGTTLHFVCAVHPWMQGRIKVR